MLEPQRECLGFTSEQHPAVFVKSVCYSRLTTKLRVPKEDNTCNEARSGTDSQ